MDDKKFGTTNAVTVKDGNELSFFLTTNRDGWNNGNRSKAIKSHLEKYGLSESRKLGNLVAVERVKYFTKVAQRRLGWGDADATREDVVSAVEKENRAELLAIMPSAAQLIERDELAVLPQLFHSLAAW